MENKTMENKIKDFDTFTNSKEGALNEDATSNLAKELEKNNYKQASMAITKAKIGGTSTQMYYNGYNVVDPKKMEKIDLAIANFMECDMWDDDGEIIEDNSLRENTYFIEVAGDNKTEVLIPLSKDQIKLFAKHLNQFVSKIK